MVISLNIHCQDDCIQFHVFFIINKINLVIFFFNPNYTSTNQIEIYIYILICYCHVKQFLNSDLVFFLFEVCFICFFLTSIVNSFIFLVEYLFDLCQYVRELLKAACLIYSIALFSLLMFLFFIPTYKKKNHTV